MVWARSIRGAPASHLTEEAPRAARGTEGRRLFRLYRRPGRGRHPLRLGRRGHQGRAPRRRQHAPYLRRPARRHGLQPDLRGRQPRQAGHRPGHHQAGGTGRADQARRGRGRLPHKRAAGVAAALWPRRCDPAGGQPAASLRRHHRLRPRRPRRPLARFRRHRVLGPLRHRLHDRAERRRAFQPHLRHGRPHDVDRYGLGDPGRALRARANRRRPPRADLAVGLGRLSDEFRHGRAAETRSRRSRSAPATTRSTRSPTTSRLPTADGW